MLPMPAWVQNRDEWISHWAKCGNFSSLRCHCWSAGQMLNILHILPVHQMCQNYFLLSKIIIFLPRFFYSHCALFNCWIKCFNKELITVKKVINSLLKRVADGSDSSFRTVTLKHLGISLQSRPSCSERASSLHIRSSGDITLRVGGRKLQPTSAKA